MRNFLYLGSKGGGEGVWGRGFPLACGGFGGGGLR